ncbi:hypothetical protein [Thalassospira sp.]|uniref:hypothetical protein n=1 Tax=Thalassospira sp. TaxID=1912094 RepID=UPI0027349C85|nr:hypothetical protein [Thalassospira sp.]MDP2697298.1 hypothetical protein [Thalassospira sp.]
MKPEDAGNMGISQLGELFSSLSATEIAKFTRAIESDRKAPRLPLPHDQILKILRPRLASLKPDRYPTPMRLFCDPFEDLLSSAPPSDKSIRISRASLMPIWNVVNESGDDGFKEALRDIETAASAGDEDKLHNAERRMWKRGAECIERAIQESESGVKTERALATRLGARAHLKAFGDVGRILRVAEEIMEVRTRFPTAPIRSLGNSDLVYLREIFMRLSAEKPGFEPVFLLAVLARLLRPSELFKLIRVLSSKADDRTISTTNLATTGDLVIDLLAETVHEIETGLASGKAEHEILGLARWYASEFVRITREFNIRKDGRWGEKLLETRRRVSQAMADTMFGASPDRIIDALPQPPRGPQTPGRAIVPLFALPFDEEKILAAEQSAEAIAETARISHILAAQSSATKAVIELKKKLNQVGRAGIDGIPRLDGADYDNALRNLMGTVRLLEIIDGPEEADLLRRRGMSALRSLEEKKGRKAS